ncbi:YqiJ family protein [Primorskyibacter sp. S187A]|uniref:YqiJ family protein n=1 Tax=Primorskyibacter sp. S187A TaxID=3415130 RepID=UPI003C7D3AC5
MYALLTSAGTIPFTISLAVVLGLFVLELLSALLGSTFLGAGTDAPDVDLDADFDLSVDADAALDLDVDAADGLDAGTTGGVFTWIGARDVPFLIWLVSFLTMFGLMGLILQSAVGSLLGIQLPALVAVAIAAVPALAVTRVIANWVALLMPKTETTALKPRHLSGARGTITQGTASRGKPAEVKIRDRFGNIHYLRVEPLHETDSFPQGSDVTLIRKRGDRFFVI